MEWEEEKEIRRTLAAQKKTTRTNGFASRVQDPWNGLEGDVKKCKNPRAFRIANRKAKHLV